MTVTTAVAAEVRDSQLGRELATQIAAGLSGRRVDLCILFASAHFEDELDEIVSQIHETLRARAFIGTTAEAIIADDQEYEGRPALTLWAAHLPNVELASFHLSQEDLERLDTPEALREHLTVPLEADPSFVLLADPFSINTLALLDGLEAAYPGRPAVGGMASAAAEPGQNALVFDGHALHAGACGVAMWGDVRMDTVVSQGCRPIGRPLVVTKAKRNIIFELGGRPAMDAFETLMGKSPHGDIELIKARGLFVGRVINEYQPQFERGDFLIRNALGFDRSTRAMAVNDLVRTGQTVQFHVQDGQTATEDLDELLATGCSAPAAGALLFSCSGRGTSLFAEKHHDARAVASTCGSLPVGGFFCAGEIGPIGERNFLHGHTASIGFFRPIERETNV